MRCRLSGNATSGFHGTFRSLPIRTFALFKENPRHPSLGFREKGGVYKSIDGGRTWNKLSNGLPKLIGRIGIRVAPSNPNVVYFGSDRTYRVDVTTMNDIYSVNAYDNSRYNGNANIAALA